MTPRHAHRARVLPFFGARLVTLVAARRAPPAAQALRRLADGALRRLADGAVPRSLACARHSATAYEAPCVEPPQSERGLIEPSFVVLTLGLALLARAVSVFPMAALANCCRTQERRIKLNEQCVIWFSVRRRRRAAARVTRLARPRAAHGRAGCARAERPPAATSQAANG